jgi:hypothetical protein
VLRRVRPQLSVRQTKCVLLVLSFRSQDVLIRKSYAVGPVKWIAITPMKLLDLEASTFPLFGRQYIGRKPRTRLRKEVHGKFQPVALRDH